MSCSLRIYLLVVATTMTLNFSGLPISGVDNLRLNDSRPKPGRMEQGSYDIVAKVFFFHPDMTYKSSRGQSCSHKVRESYPGAAHSQKDAITMCPVRDSNHGPLCAIPTTLTTQPLRRTKVWSGNQADVLQSQN